MANSLQVATINGVGDFILFLGKLAVGLICGLVSILILRNNPDIHFYIIPCIFIAFFSFFIAHIILSLFEVRINFIYTILTQNARTYTTSCHFDFPLFIKKQHFFVSNFIVQLCGLDGGRHIIFMCL